MARKQTKCGQLTTPVQRIGYACQHAGQFRGTSSVSAGHARSWRIRGTWASTSEHPLGPRCRVPQSPLDELLTTAQWISWNRLVAERPRAIGTALTIVLDRVRPTPPTEMAAMPIWAAQVALSTLDRLGPLKMALTTVVGLSHQTSRGTQPTNAKARTIPDRMASFGRQGDVNGQYEKAHAASSTATCRRPTGKSTWMCPKSRSSRWPGS